MHIKQLDISGIRNLNPVRLHLSKNFNAFYGANGSGKTSILEAIYILGLGRSFRAANLQQIISFEQLKYVVSGVVVDELSEDNGVYFRIGTEKAKDNAKALYIKDEEKSSVGILAKLLPVLLINSNSSDLVDGGPIYRRAFIDFGMFYVEHYFLNVCHKFKKCLAQRNAELKTNAILAQKRKQLEAWDEDFITTAEGITVARKKFVVDFTKIFNKLIAGWQYCGHVTFQYKKGWPEDLNLREALNDSLNLDLITGCTNRGPHRAELEIFIDGIPAKNMLSRGQQKVLASAMILSKAIFSKEKAQIDSVFLVDDLSSELDQTSFNLVINKLKEIGGQVFITGIEQRPLLEAIEKYEFNPDAKMFHVEQYGEIKMETIAVDNLNL